MPESNSLDPETIILLYFANKSIENIDWNLGINFNLNFSSFSKK